MDVNGDFTGLRRPEYCIFLLPNAVSKTLILVRDRDIKDPNILEQFRAGWLKE